jgi:hypothetical protein
MVLTVIKLKFVGCASAGTSFVKTAPTGSSATFTGVASQESKFLGKENELCLLTYFVLNKMF